jgi:methenyltetrahydromethanopterin cyclohydrolase
MQLNAGARRVVEEMLSQPDRLGVSCHASTSGTRIVDCGVKSAGSDEAGLLLARAALAGLGTVGIEPAKL